MRFIFNQSETMHKSRNREITLTLHKLPNYITVLALSNLVCLKMSLCFTMGGRDFSCVVLGQLVASAKDKSSVRAKKPVAPRVALFCL